MASSAEDHSIEGARRPEPNPITWPAVALVAVLVAGALGLVWLLR